MNKREYLDSLREFLSYELPSRMVESNIRFYENYFDEQQKLGRSFQEIEEELGDPQLIARSCIDAARSGADGIPNSGDDLDFTEEIEREFRTGRHADDGQKQQERKNSTGNVHTVSGPGCIIFSLLLLAVAVCLAAFFSTPLGLTILGFVLLAWLIRRLFKN